MASRTLRYDYERDNNTISKTVTETGTGVVTIDNETVADSTTDGELAFTLDVSACVMFYIVSDQNVTVETNDGSSADNTLSLIANEPYFWHSSSLDSFLLDTDVTSIFVTNASGSTATIFAEAIYDATP